jgi:type IV pilus assembly protein PilO
MKFGVRELVFVCVLLGMLGWTYMDFMKKQADRRNLDADTEQIRTELVQLKQATAGIEDLGRKIDDLQKAIDFFESKLPQEKEMDKILAEVSQMADANALQTKTVKTLKSERTANYSEQPIQMSLSGDFNGFYAFLLQLEKLARITRVTQMNLQKIDEHDGQMQAQMTLSIYFEPENGSVAGAN